MPLKFLALFDTMQKQTILEFIRFGFVGVMNTAFSYMIYAMLLFAGLNYALANLGAVVLGILFSFRTQGKLVFRQTDVSLLPRFIVAWASIYAINVFLISRFINLGFDPYTAGALMLPASAILSYFIQKYFVFRT